MKWFCIKLVRFLFRAAASAPSCGALHLLRPLGGPCVLQTAAPKISPCMPLFVAARHLPPAGGSLCPQAAVGILALNSWNDYFMQLIMLSSTSNLTISLGIAKLQAENSTDFGLIMAGAALAAVPIIIIFLIFQKYFTKGIAMGAVKG